MKKFKKSFGGKPWRNCHSCSVHVKNGIRTVAIYSAEDKEALFRTMADESYQVGAGKSRLMHILALPKLLNWQLQRV